MKAIRTFLIVYLSIGMVAGAANAPAPSAPTASALCQINLGNISRAVPRAEERQAQLRAVQTTLAQVRATVESGQKQQISGQVIAKPNWPAGSQAAKTIEGGVVWHFDDSGESHTGKNYSPSDYRKLQQMLADAAKVLESGAGHNEKDNPVSYFEISDPEQIEKFLKTTDRVPTLAEIRQAKEAKDAADNAEKARLEVERNAQAHRDGRRQNEINEKTKKLALACMWVGGGAGLLGGGIYALNRDPNKKLDEAIVAHARETTVTDRKTHIALLREAWKDRYDKEEAIKKHEAQLDTLEKLGVKLRFGARYGDYLPSLGTGSNRRDYYDRPELDPLKLATQERPLLTVDTLQYEVDHPDSRQTFTKDEIAERKNKDSTGFLHVVTGIGEAIGAAGVTGGLAWTGCQAAGGRLVAAFHPVEPQTVVNPVEPAPVVHPQPPSSPTVGNPPPELAEFRKVVDAAFSPDYRTRTGPPRQVLVTGANTNDGLHSLLFLVVDNQASPPTVKIAGLGFRTEIAKPPAEPQTTAAPSVAKAKPLDLKLLRERLVNAHFQNRYLDDLNKLDDVFALANKLKSEGKLEGDDARQFQDQVDQLIATQELTPDHLKVLKRFLVDVQVRRSR